MAPKKGNTENKKKKTTLKIHQGGGYHAQAEALLG
jgi:hypothetical protein